MTSTAVPTYLAFDVPDVTFYRNLRLGQGAANWHLLGLVVVALAGLAFTAHRRERAVRRRERRIDTLLHNAHDVVLVLDDDGRATFVSSAVQRLLGYGRHEIETDRLGAYIHPDDAAAVATMFASTRADGRGAVDGVRLRDARGSYRTFDLRAVDRRDRPEVAGIILTAHDVTARTELQDELARRATTDPLTGLPNRAGLNAYLDQLGDAADRAYAVVFVDLDRFKEVNDELGHDAGDQVLRVMAERFQRSVRWPSGPGGTARPEDCDHICRLGGDEFAVLLLDVTRAEAEQTGRRLLEAARRPVRLSDRAVQLGATIGISLGTTGRSHPDQAIRRADQAMYQAKHEGRNTLAMA